MIVTWRIGLRLAAIVLIAVLVQVSFLSYLSILGAAPDALPVVVAILGLLGGAVTGAVVGFAAGLLVDSLLLQTLGVSSLVLLSVGYLAGRYRELFEIDSRLTPAAPRRRPDADRHGRLRRPAADAGRRGARQPAGRAGGHREGAARVPPRVPPLSRCFASRCGRPW